MPNENYPGVQNFFVHVDSTVRRHSSYVNGRKITAWTAVKPGGDGSGGKAQGIGYALPPIAVDRNFRRASRPAHVTGLKQESHGGQSRQGAGWCGYWWDVHRRRA
ncbi:hypothetical protein BN2475_310019 [Paraburkholderia ribeironis]|uniref:Uncharacterized protein n=1 Tax=Paraburkholderia ribeironis TaxID=1247936 RepID=A0A1N7S1Z9_9BURK|nr:hypothetical protein BN2475_310019 [Paraburkholderia ribeironis]